MKNTEFKAFIEGFVGSFVLDAMIVMVIRRAISGFINAPLRKPRNDTDPLLN